LLACSCTPNPLARGATPESTHRNTGSTERASKLTTYEFTGQSSPYTLLVKSEDREASKSSPPTLWPLHSLEGPFLRPTVRADLEAFSRLPVRYQDTGIALSVRQASPSPASLPALLLSDSQAFTAEKILTPAVGPYHCRNRNASFLEDVPFPSQLSRTHAYIPSCL